MIQKGSLKNEQRRLFTQCRLNKPHGLAKYRQIANPFNNVFRLPIASQQRQPENEVNPIPKSKTHEQA
ncbi:hypothetical protein [Kingella oralis]|uniref:hypothetical protein n=1 Tax=Kingella oralis TaxID=505 RepID=UPI002D7FE4E4|nr:hypothetical protein [Kingella oralis]